MKNKKLFKFKMLIVSLDVFYSPNLKSNKNLVIDHLIYFLCRLKIQQLVNCFFLQKISM